MAISSDGKDLRKTSKLLVFIAYLPHLFCCGIPIVAAFISLGATAGLGAALASNPLYGFLDRFHIPLLIFASFVVLITGLINLYAYKIDCTKLSDSCTHKSCKPKKLRSFRIFLISLFLLILDFSWFIFEKFYFINL